MNALTSYAPNSPPPSQTREQADLLAAYLSATERTPAGHCSISDRKAPSVEHRQRMEDRRAILRRSMERCDPRVLPERLARMFLRFPAMADKASGKAAEAILAAYATDLSKYPIWAVDGAILAILRGTGHSSAAFAPSSLEVQEQAKRMMAPVLKELADLSAVLDAGIYHEPTAAERERVKAGFDALCAELRLREPFAPVKRAPNQMTKAEAEALLEMQAANPAPIPALSDEARARLGILRDMVPDQEAAA